MTDPWTFTPTGTPRQVARYRHWEAEGEAWFTCPERCDSYRQHQEHVQADDLSSTEPVCLMCSKPLTPRARYCSKACKMRAYRERKGG